MLREWCDEREILVKDWLPLFQLVLTDFGFGKWTFLQFCSAFKKGKEVDRLGCVPPRGVWAVFWVLRKYAHD